jgi:Protein kinase domain/WD40-like Beta Propeller Repeat
VPDEKLDRRPGEGDETAPEPGPTAEVAATAPVRPGLVLAGRYAVERIIGRGGMGIVVRAHDRALDEAVAIKILRAEYAGERVWSDRLAREVKLARHIQHPNVCRMFDFEEADGRVFLVMELAARGALREEIASGATANRPLAARIADAAAMAAGLTSIHDAGIVHRDVSPQNVLRMSDGRLVLSDFGLAIDPSESTVSIRGGTIAYMAPEIARGGQVGRASDVWALGVVVHEAVFGQRPAWRGTRGQMLAPRLARKLSPDERTVLEVCRACASPDPARRPTAAQVQARLSPGVLGRSRWARRARWATAALGAALAVAASARALDWFHRMPVANIEAGVAPPVPAIEIYGQPEDWADVAQVIGEISDRIHCVVPLPDRHTVRIVWGYPRHAEDLDTRSGVRVPSPVVAAAFAEGCPDVSPDGQRLVFQGHVPDGRAFAFLSDHPDGREAVPVVATAEPSHASDPRWLSSGDAFSFDVDLEHPAIFAAASRRTSVIATPVPPARSSIFRWTTGEGLFVGIPSGSSGRTDFIGFDAATLGERSHFAVPGVAMDLVALADGRFLYVLLGAESVIVEVDPHRRRGRRLAVIGKQAIRFPTQVEDGYFLTSRRHWATVSVGPTTFTVHQLVDSATLCGDDVLTAEEDDNHRGRIARRRRDGTLIRYLTDGPDDWSVSCTQDGHWYFSKFDRSGGPLMVCTADDAAGDACRPVLPGPSLIASVSPDGRRVAFVHLERRGLRISLADLTDLEPLHLLRETDSACRPVWSGRSTLWISRRQGGAFAWGEVDVASGRDTGRVRPGTSDCSDGFPDPSAPEDVNGVRVVNGRMTELRVIASKYLQP